MALQALLASPGTIISALVSVLALMVCHAVLGALLSPLRSVPGPFVARFSKLWYLRQILRGDFQRTDVGMHRELGKIVRIAPNWYSLDDPSAVRTIYGHGTRFVKGPWYAAFSDPDAHAEDMFSGPDPRQHALNRRKVAGLYSMSMLLRMEEAVDATIGIFERRMSEVAGMESVIDLQHWAQCYAFDTIGLITLNKRFGMLDKGEDTLNLIPVTRGLTEYGGPVGVYSWVHKPLIRILKRWFSHGRFLITEFSEEQIRVRRQLDGAWKDGREDKKNDGVGGKGENEGKEGEDFLAKVLLLHEQDPERFTWDDVINTLNMNVAAGSDTTSISLTGVLAGLAGNKDAMAKLRKELDTAAYAGEISDPITFAQAQRLPYLQAVVQEGLRVHPAVGLPMWRVVPSGGAELCGRFFGEGAVVGINPWVAHANKDVFGLDADVFRPERWLCGKEERQKMERYSLEFGHGSRTCIGKNISLMEIQKLVPQVVRKFDIELALPEEGLRLHNRWFVYQENMMVRVGARKE